MGILDSDLVKTGVDIATKLLEIINKATNGIEGFGGDIIKIVGVFGIFKLGMKVFQKFKPAMIKFFADVVKEAKDTGERAVRAMDEGAREEARRTSNS
jgi:hypothetical protein